MLTKMRRITSIGQSARDEHAVFAENGTFAHELAL
jgi:hypothetical protein